jgi:hypothetical protein
MFIEIKPEYHGTLYIPSHGTVIFLSYRFTREIKLSVISSCNFVLLL